MRKTTNYGLTLYDKEDKMSITAEENSLNASMEIIDKTLLEKAEVKYLERIGHFVSNSGINYEINTTTKEITINEGFLFYLGQRQNDLQSVKTTLKLSTSSVFSYIVYDLKGTAGEKLLCVTQTEFDTTRHILMCIVRRDYYTIPSANWIEGRYKVDGVLYNPEEPKEPIETVYVSTTGTDTNNETGDRDHPFLTINKAINSGAKTIFVMAGTYKESITKSLTGGEIEIIAKPLNTTDKKDVIIDLGYELSMTAESTTGLVKSTYTSTADDFIYKVFVTGEKPIKYVENNTEGKEVSRGYTCNLWSGNTRLTPVLSLEECKNTSNSWYHDGTNIYANANAGTFVLDNGTNQYGINLSYYKKVKLIGITVKYASEIGIWLKGCSESEINRCKFMNTGVYHGLKLESTSSTVRNCEAGYNGKDGLNIHGVSTADFIDCVSHDNLDDGISHHVNSGGMVIGGEYYNNGKGGVCSPTFGSRNGINGVYTHNNVAGIYAVTSVDGDYPPCTVSNCAIIGNETGIRTSRYTLNCWNNILKDNGNDTLCENNGVINMIS